MVVIEVKKPGWNFVGGTIEKEFYEITSTGDFSLTKDGFKVWPKNGMEVGYSAESFVKYTVEEWDKTREY